MMKDEAPYLLEWFAHHLAVGFTDILVYTNDCSDGTDDMLIRLEELGLGYHRRNVIPEGKKPQPSAIKHAQADPIVQQSDWVMVFDADEFLCIRHGDGTLDGMISEAMNMGANGIVVTWRIFGSSQICDWSRAPVTEQFILAAPPQWNKGWGVKTLFKFDPDYWKLGIHRPAIKNKHLQSSFPDKVLWLNGSGIPMEDYFKFRGWRSIRRTIGYDWAQMNHYAVKSLDSYIIRRFRGNVNNKKDKYNSEYWALQDRNEIKDETILRHAGRRQEIVNELLKDPVLNKLHFAALERVETQLAKYKETDSYQEFKDELIAAGQTPIQKIVAAPPKARDPARIAGFEDKIPKKIFERSREKRSDTASKDWSDDFLYPIAAFQNNPDIDVISNHNIMIPVDPEVFAPDALNLVAAGKYARRQLRHITNQIDKGDRLLSLGGEAGVVAMRALREVPDVFALSHHSRKDIARVAEELAGRNNLLDSSRLKIESGPLVLADDGDGEASGLMSYIRDFRPTVLRVFDRDVKPGVLAKLRVEHLKRLILPVELFCEAASQEDYLAAISALGFIHKTAWQDQGMLVFDQP